MLFIIFIIDATEATVNASLSLKDLIGTGHRVDVICRELVAAFWWGSILQRNAIVFIAFKKQPALRVDGASLSEPLVPKTELGFARLLLEIYVNGAHIPGFTVINQSIVEIVQNLQQEGTPIWWLDEGGQDFRNPPRPIGAADAFVLGDHRGISEEFSAHFHKIIPRISLGPKSYLGSACIHILLGRQSF